MSADVHGERPQARAQDLIEELEHSRVTFHQLLDQASSADLRRQSRGTRWTNEQLLFHMLFGYLIVRALRPLVKGFGRLPDGMSRVYARLLNSADRTFQGSTTGDRAVGRGCSAAPGWAG